jgi:hypothetical protein
MYVNSLSLSYSLDDLVRVRERVSKCVFATNAQIFACLNSCSRMRLPIAHSFLPLLLLHKHRRCRHRRRVQLTHRCASIASNQTILRRRRGRGGEEGGGEESNIIIRRSRVFMTAECDFFFFILPFFFVMSSCLSCAFGEWVSEWASEQGNERLSVWSGLVGVSRLMTSRAETKPPRQHPQTNETTSFSSFPLSLPPL